jgi:uncharacterized protein YdhG (YjbR/CyaY superfamily)
MPAIDPKVTQYINKAPPKTRKALRTLRSTIRRAAPGITERISYRMPTFDLDGKYLLYMAAFKEHVSVYPVSDNLAKKVGRSVDRYRHGRGTLRFALDEPLPITLITRLAKARVAERRARNAR